MISRAASCGCGRLTLVCEGEPARVSMCHCRACQKRTGSVFGVQARWPAELVHMHGQATEWGRVGDDGGKITFRFCPTCGSTVAYDIDTMPGMIAVPVGAFADAAAPLPAPVFSVYEARKHPWVVVPESAEHMA